MYGKPIIYYVLVYEECSETDQLYTCKKKNTDEKVLSKIKENINEELISCLDWRM